VPDLEHRPMRALGIYTRRSPNGTLIETYHDGYEVNGTGAFIWSRVGSGATGAEIAAEVAAEYGITAELAGHTVAAFLTELEDRGFLSED
jgi:hypothetical protein